MRKWDDIERMNDQWLENDQWLAERPVFMLYFETKPSNAFPRLRIQGFVFHT